jgi:MFS family permease
MPPSSIGIWFGGAVAVSLVIGNISGGWLADRLGKRDLRQYLWIAGTGPILSFIPGLVFAFSSSWQVAIAAVFVLQLVLTTHIPTCYMLAQSLVQPRMRSMSAVVVGLASGVVGAGLGPLLVGQISDLLTPAHGAESIRYALIAPITGALAAGLMAFLGARHVRADYARLSAS